MKEEVWARQESNPDLVVRSHALYPLNYRPAGLILHNFRGRI